VFDNSDNFIFNSDLVDEYINFLTSHDLLFDTIEAKRRFVTHLKSEGTIDHQIRRAFLEIMCLHIAADDKYGLRKVVDDFRNDVPGAYNQDEFKVAEKLTSCILPENAAD